MPSSQVKPVNFILLGDPAAGKATQGALLAKKFKLFDFDMGQELAHLRARNKKIDRLLKSYNDRGKLTPTSIARKILRDTITSVPAHQGILFDGHPKMLGEAKIAAQLLKKKHRLEPLVLYITIPAHEVVRRVQARKGYFKGKYGKRGDDSEAGLKNRARYYRKNIAQVVSFFESHYQFHRINGLGTPREVHDRIMKVVNKFTNE